MTCSVSFHLASAHLVSKLCTSIVKSGDQVVTKSLQARLVAYVDLPGIRHRNSIQGTPTVHAQWSGMHDLQKKEIMTAKTKLP